MSKNGALLLVFCFILVFSNVALAARWSSRVIRFVPKRTVVKKIPAKAPAKIAEAVPPPAAEVKIPKELQASILELLPKKTNLPSGLLGVKLSPKSPPGRQLVMGSTDNVLAVFTATETIGGEVKISELTFLDDISSKGAMTSWIMPSFTNLTLWQGNKKIAVPVSLVNNDSNSYKIVFSLTSPIVISPNETTNLILKGDVLPITSTQVSDNSTHIFKILSGVYFADAKPITIVATKLAVNSSLLGVASGRARKIGDELATIKFTAANDASLKVNKMVLTFSGDALVEGQSLAVDLDDFYVGSNIAHSQCAVGANKSCSMLFLLGIYVSVSSNVVLKIKLNSDSLANNPSTGDSLLVSIKDATDVDWNNNAALDAVAVPVTIAKINYE